MKLIEIIKELKVEVSRPNIFQAVVAKQYDMNTRFIKATLVDGSDDIYIPSGPTIKAIINANRPDGQSKGFDGAVNEDGTVTVPLHSWMLEMEGTVICDISIIDTEADDNKKLTTTAFTLLVEKAAYGGNDITNDPQYDVMVQLLETCAEASTVAQEALEKSNAALEKSAEADSKYDACVKATENANNVRTEIEAGGYIESLKEMNAGGKFSFWVGTQAEYDALSEKMTNCFYIITDDKAADDIDQRISTLEGRQIADNRYKNCYYRIVGTAQEWVNPPMEPEIEYRLTERMHGYVVYTQLFRLTPEEETNGKFSTGGLIFRYHAWTENYNLPYNLNSSARYQYIDVNLDGTWRYYHGSDVGTPERIWVQAWYYKH